MKFWLMKSEPGAFSIDDLSKEGFSGWDGVRNYQARNYMRDDMNEGDLALFYHSNANPSGVAGICRITETDIVDPTAFDPDSQYFDPKSSEENPRWIMVEVEFVEKFPRFVPLSEIKGHESLSDMKLVQKGSRLSIMPITKKHFQTILKLGKSKIKP
jgi:predicted RNA-binding protein with PUA-like domain